jgi:hypothetical protein
MLAVLALENLLLRENKTTISIGLVIAGGYDPRVAENVEYHDEILNYVTKKKLNKQYV